MKFIFVLNPTSGTHRNPEKIRAFIENSFQDSEHDYSIRNTEYVGHATEIAKEEAEKASDVIVAIGGDGTVNEVAKGILFTKTALAIVPAGSGNGFARHFKIPLNQEKAIKELIHYKIKKIDTGVINGHHFNGVCGMGYDASVSQKFSEQNSRGLKTYIKVMLKEYFNFKPELYKLTFNNNRIERRCYTLSVANAPEYGNGAIISPDSVVDDGLLEICAMRPLGVFASISVAFHMMNGSLNRCKHIEYFKTDKVIIERSMDNTIHVDGTALQTDLNVSIEVVKQSLNVWIPFHE